MASASSRSSTGRTSSSSPSSDDALYQASAMREAEQPILSQEEREEAQLEGEKMKFNRLAYWIVALLGVGLLLPWNVALNAIDFFDEIYPGKDIGYYIPVAYVYPQLPLLFLMVKFGNRVSFTVRIVTTYGVQAVAIAILPFIARSSEWVTLGFMFLMGICTAVLQSSLMGFSSQFPPIYNQAIMMGQGIAGMVASFSRVATKASLQGQLQISAILYFEIAAAVLVACTVGYLQLLRMPFAQHYLQQARALARKRAWEELTSAGTGRRESAAQDFAVSPKPSPPARKGGREGGGTRDVEIGERTPVLTPITWEGAVNGGGRSGSMERKGRGSEGGGASAVFMSAVSPDVGPRDGSLVRVPTLDEAIAADRRATTPVGDGENRGRTGSFMTLRMLEQSPAGLKYHTRTGSDDGVALMGMDAADLEKTLQRQQNKSSTSWVRIKHIVSRVWAMGLVEFLVFTTTLSLFPGMTDNIRYKGTIKGMDALGEHDWWPIVLVTIFNCFDTIGRYIPAKFKACNYTWLPIGAALRMAFIPWFVGAVHSTGWIYNDVITVIVMILFAATNGYSASLAFMYGPERVEQDDKEVCGFLLSLMLQLGMFSGSQIALEVKDL